MRRNEQDALIYPQPWATEKHKEEERDDFQKEADGLKIQATPHQRDTTTPYVSM
ncbi:hypothetical protein GLOTRDRAFT_134384 [Gloeophyllum trabeum ATCC 11539]|uniref:Uncharacterized protein n=1 Tax=Gloeophyllum trabeum (strain ATCC 11539 / FP-39264 / Madison 617) TaxID=670483 RepID=S7PRA5_GLOTA|nr:uncharacterized protein GLOTRDRAFT_134384 [Gloeophyllum trabeum ATCC 11539]EPQ49978.1 hypothetical protein GLOTRDRAFT_134384 [Gloeophyllum trabeum ATCC 11539]